MKNVTHVTGDFSVKNCVMQDGQCGLLVFWSKNIWPIDIWSTYTRNKTTLVDQKTGAMTFSITTLIIMAIGKTDLIATLRI